MKFKRVVSIIVLFSLLGFFIYYIYNHQQDFQQLQLVNPLLILALMGLTLIFSVNNGLVTKFLLQPFKINLKAKEWFGLSVTTTFYNLITPFKGGAVSRALYLKNKYNFTYSSFLATLSGSYVIIVLTAVTAGLVSTAAIYFIHNQINFLILSILLIFFFPLLTIVLFSPRIPETKNSIINKFIHVINGWHSIKSNRKSIFYTFLFTLCNLITGTIGLMITYGILGIKVEFFKALFMTSVGSLSILIAITPGGIGITEAIAIFLASLVGITPAQSLTASIIGRVASMIVIFILGPIFSYILLNTAKKKNKA